MHDWCVAVGGVVATVAVVGRRARATASKEEVFMVMTASKGRSFNGEMEPETEPAPLVASGNQVRLA